MIFRIKEKNNLADPRLLNRKTLSEAEPTNNMQSAQDRLARSSAPLTGHELSRLKRYADNSLNDDHKIKKVRLKLKDNAVSGQNGSTVPSTITINRDRLNTADSDVTLDSYFEVQSYTEMVQRSARDNSSLSGNETVGLPLSKSR